MGRMDRSISSLRMQGLTTFPPTPSMRAPEHCRRCRPGPPQFPRARTRRRLLLVSGLFAHWCTSTFVANHGGSNDISAFQLKSWGLYLTEWPVRRFPLAATRLAWRSGPGEIPLLGKPRRHAPEHIGLQYRPDYRALSPLSGSPFPLPVSHYIATDQTGAYLYVTSGANIVGDAIDG